MFLLKYTLRFLIFNFDLNVKHRRFFSNKRLGQEKKDFIENFFFFAVDYIKINELHVLHI